MWLHDCPTAPKRFSVFPTPVGVGGVWPTYGVSAPVERLAACPVGARAREASNLDPSSRTIRVGCRREAPTPASGAYPNGQLRLSVCEGLPIYKKRERLIHTHSRHSTVSPPLHLPPMSERQDHAISPRSSGHTLGGPITIFGIPTIMLAAALRPGSTRSCARHRRARRSRRRCRPRQTP